MILPQESRVAHVRGNVETPEGWLPAHLRHEAVCGVVWVDELGLGHTCNKQAEHRDDVPHGDGQRTWW